MFTYRFGAGGLMKSPKYYNDMISGMSLLGEVAKGDKEDVYVKLDIDNRKGGTYPYPFRPETGNMMYCMLQVGTKVSLYFPSFDEYKAMVVNCFRTNGGDCQQMSDLSKRTFITEHGKELTLYPKQMALKSNTTGSAITLDDDTGIHIYSHKALSITRAEIKFNAPVIKVKAKLGEINMMKLDPQFPLVTSSITMSNQFDIVSKGGTEVVGRKFATFLAFDDMPEKKKFDLAAFTGELLYPDNSLTEFNQKLHSNKEYNYFQIGISSVAVFTSAARSTMTCFVADTPVLTDSGLAVIENIKTGDKVISTNVETFETVENTVLEAYIRKVKELVHLTINGELIKTTLKHPFYVKTMSS